jgi:Putative zinc-finger
VQEDRKFGSPGTGSGNEISCAEFDLMLGEAVDGALPESSMARVRQHIAGCRTCGPIFSETQAGLSWLKLLEPAEPPAHLVHNILAATTAKEESLRSATRRGDGWRQRISHILESVLAPLYGALRQPRFALNAAMAFFSISLLLNVAGVKVSELRLADLTPSAIKANASSRYYETSNKVVKYYESIRVVYELESTVRDLKRAVTTDNEREKQSQPKKKDDTSQQPNEKHNENYSREANGLTYAAWHRTSADPLNAGRAIEARGEISILKPMRTEDFVNGNDRRLA